MNFGLHSLLLVPLAFAWVNIILVTRLSTWKTLFREIQLKEMKQWLDGLSLTPKNVSDVRAV